MADFIENPKSPEAASVFDLTEEKQVLMNALLTLPKQERLVLTLYYFEDMLLKEIGKVMSISESRVSQIHGKALLSLRARMRRAMYSPPPVVRDN
ncbi:MAG: sigma-70 family RNA polymerase sigma factor [Planctomycetes bacterium]|nr:sigma-70 family RNA polymerase sigma factor [Planctomycetota bacterium]